MIDRTAENREIAEWLEPLSLLDTITVLSDGSYLGGSVWHASGMQSSSDWRDYDWQPADFFTAEAANAMVLEKMPAAQIYFQPMARVWVVVANAFTHGYQYKATEDPDRKTAIALAALAYIDSQKDK